MRTLFTLVRTSEELLPGVAAFEETLENLSHQSIGFGGIVGRGGEFIQWPSHEKHVIEAMDRTGTDLVELEGEEDSGEKWIKTFKKTSGKAALISCESVPNEAA